MFLLNIIFEYKPIFKFILFSILNGILSHEILVLEDIRVTVSLTSYTTEKSVSQITRNDVCKDLLLISATLTKPELSVSAVR